ncbi:MAG: HAD family hydrolase [Ignavibacteria bacterium]|nr:MAG: HAD family hydrolase [Ignavibacteria bacterium]
MKAVLFDFGGTIDTDGIHWSEEFWEFYRRLGVLVGREEFEAAYLGIEKELADGASLGEMTFYETLRRQLSGQFKRLGLPEGDPRLEKMLDACYAHVAGVIRKATPLLEELSKRFRLGIVSNFYGNLEAVCREFALNSYFTTLVDSAVVGMRKPDPRIWSLGVEKLGVLPGLTFVIGDSYERDIIPAKSLGCTTVWLKGKRRTLPPSTADADYTIMSLGEVKRILLPASD